MEPKGFYNYRLLHLEAVSASVYGLLEALTSLPDCDERREAKSLVHQAADIVHRLKMEAEA